MNQVNQTLVTEFVFLGLTDDPHLQIPLFVLFLLVYIMAVLGNVGMMILIRMSPCLHTPMYFLLSHLSFLDVSCSSVVTPTLVMTSVFKRLSVSVLGCATQLFLFMGLGSTEVFILTMMAYDRYIAICRPLVYKVIMNHHVCVYFVVGAYVLALFHAVLQTTCTFRLTFCGSNEILHFYCELPPLLKLSCTDTSLSEALLVFVAGGFMVFCLVIIFTSYIFIVAAILRIHSSDGRSRAFSTCSSHFVCVTLFFGTLLFVYGRPSSNHSIEQDRVAAAIYSMLIPMTNPFIYSLRNQQVKQAMRKAIGNLCVAR
ncbi:olfactory receptor 5AR1-like [Pleurodeles waltl]|uniref:olfactory receptor 5AR1-like n=1 Tax=Pleurodeles waltl TaxID=8319 RepID=UPI0037095B42